MNLNIPIKVQVRGTAKSGFTRETIENRLAVLRERQDTAAKEEAAYLERLKNKLPD